MLVLSRKQSERLIIGDNIVVTIVRIAGSSVRLGIEAPPEVQIQREEVRCREKVAPNQPRIRAA